MNTEKFVTALIEEVHNSSVKDIVAELWDGPPGRSPTENSVMLSEWFHVLDDKGKQKIKTVIERSVHSAIFGVFAVLDGVRVIENGGGEFEIKYTNSSGTHTLNDQHVLHDIYQALVYEKVFEQNA